MAVLSLEIVIPDELVAEVSESVVMIWGGPDDVDTSPAAARDLLKRKIVRELKKAVAQRRARLGTDIDIT